MESTRVQILQAGLELFSELGYVGATTRGIARRAGITEVTLFRYFPTKEKLFEEVVNAYLPTPGFSEIIFKAKDLAYRDALAMIAGAFMEGLRTEKKLIQIMYSESQRYADLMARVYMALVDNLISLLAAYFEGLQHDGLIRKFNARAGATAFLGMWSALYEAKYLLQISGFSEIDETEIAKEYIDIFFTGTQKTS
ncbi:MAG TPA: TetR/AcrR family transcriptional regulator [Candidatus Limnocylindrales bacterium]|nr:TetR/AcrR family transcriptional regulator [Candidatus Limnocylindrales bacterium]